MRPNFQPNKRHVVTPRLDLHSSGQVRIAYCTCGRRIFADSLIFAVVVDIVQWQAKCPICKKWVQLPRIRNCKRVVKQPNNIDNLR